MIFPEPPAEGGAAAPDAGRRGAPVTRRLRAAGGALAALLVAMAGGWLAARGTGELRIPGAGVTTVLRTVVYAALAVHLGELAGRRLARAAAPGDAPPGLPDPAGLPGLPEPRRWAVGAALAGAAGSAGQIVVLARVSGLDLATVYGTTDGRLLLVMANGFLLAAGCATLTRPALALLPLAAVIGAEALRAHPEQYTPLLGAALTVVHLTAASLWTGGLLHVLRVVREGRGRGDPERAAGIHALLGRYARHAARLLALLAATGTVSAVRRLPADVVFGTAYGRVLLAKLALVAVVCALALTARLRLRRGGDAVRPARAELAVLAVVVLVSAVLTVVPDPHWLSIR
ncbi:CopD family protein [Streptomyces sp. NPDC093085]|uniref:CopD family protein n=1 Tax=Streptomyces sp. NPDC093085 TaxID=3155068 RepID=UPI00343FBCB4